MFLDLHSVFSVSGRSQRSLADANRPDRRAVLDRERARAVAEKQAEALKEARAMAEKKAQEKLQVCMYKLINKRLRNACPDGREVLTQREHTS